MRPQPTLYPDIFCAFESLSGTLPLPGLPSQLFLRPRASFSDPFSFLKDPFPFPELFGTPFPIPEASVRNNTCALIASCTAEAAISSISTAILCGTH